MANNLRMWMGDAVALAQGEVDGEPFAEWARQERAVAIEDGDLSDALEAVFEGAEGLGLFTLVGYWRHLPPVIADLRDRLAPRLGGQVAWLVPQIMGDGPRPVPALHHEVVSLFVDPDWEGVKAFTGAEMAPLLAAARAELTADPVWAAAGQGEQLGTAWSGFLAAVDRIGTAEADQFFLVDWDW